MTKRYFPSHSGSFPINNSRNSYLEFVNLMKKIEMIFISKNSDSTQQDPA